MAVAVLLPSGAGLPDSSAPTASTHLDRRRVRARLRECPGDLGLAAARAQTAKGSALTLGTDPIFAQEGLVETVGSGAPFLAVLSGDAVRLTRPGEQLALEEGCPRPWLAARG